jgi:quercetin dioxygenase-like cupin family protein
MSDSPKYHIIPSEMPSYRPANHTGTKNTRLIGPRVNGAKYLEIALGEIERHEGAPAHAHPALEQAVYILEGEAIANINGVPHHVKAGEMMYFPEKVFHDIKILSEKIKMLVIYAPPYDEDPDKVMQLPETTAP